MRHRQHSRHRRSRITEQINPAFLSSDDPFGNRAGTEEDYYWRALSGDVTRKDLLPATYLELHEQCYEAWSVNPLASAILEITTSFVLGKGVLVEASEPAVQRILMNFWHDAANQMDERIYTLCHELALYGEIFLRFFVNKFDGSVRVRLIDPSLIDVIETDPEDIETPRRFHRRAINLAGSGIAVSPSQSALPVADNTDGVWFVAGEEVMQFAINKVSNAKRGRSDLATLLPWLRRYKDWLTDRVRINKYKGAFLWDVELTGADRKTLDRKRMEYQYPPESGSVVFHAETEKWTAVQPSIQANDVKEDGRAIKLMIAVGAGLPEHYLSDSSQGNRATAAEMGLPTLLRFQRRQKILKLIFRTILDRVLLEAQNAGKLAREIDTTYDIVFPEIDVTDHLTIAGALQSLAKGLSIASSHGWVSDATAMRILFQMVGEDVDVHEELARIANQPLTTD
ncbi:hypothetical protein KDW_27880 [Dictyobacter vulcani]|uniref:Portal protein n=1 Tax=Dictyobacter vulcani TaxID=2607529 RepID=A0A5J4KTU8_9CHLR|nr:hypothetical protein [Dictyobacter vulcani]GER88626.1 hypothetical protein KDW_27880 [Dictyobacter vulcani]